MIPLPSSALCASYFNMRYRSQKPRRAIQESAPSLNNHTPLINSYQFLINSYQFYYLNLSWIYCFFFFILAVYLCGPILLTRSWIQFINPCLYLQSCIASINLYFHQEDGMILLWCKQDLFIPSLNPSMVSLRHNLNPLKYLVRLFQWHSLLFAFPNIPCLPSPVKLCLPHLFSWTTFSAGNLHSIFLFTLPILLISV